MMPWSNISLATAIIPMTKPIVQLSSGWEERESMSLPNSLLKQTAQQTPVTELGQRVKHVDCRK